MQILRGHGDGLYGVQAPESRQRKECSVVKVGCGLWWDRVSALPVTTLYGLGRYPVR